MLSDDAAGKTLDCVLCIWFQCAIPLLQCKTCVFCARRRADRKQKLPLMAQRLVEYERMQPLDPSRDGNEEMNLLHFPILQLSLVFIVLNHRHMLSVLSV